MDQKIKSLIEYFNRHLLLDKREVAIVEQSFFQRKIKRRQFILQEGEICKVSTFVVSGCLRTYMVDNSGSEHNLQFAIENWWTGDIGSFHGDVPSKLNIEAMEDSVILQIKKEDLIELYEELPKFNRIFRVLAENAMVSLQRRTLLNISSTAEERYLDFMNRYPFLFNRISNVQIASYLGITPEFLSTIRKKLTKS